MTPERKQRILDIAQELEDQGLEATNSAVYSRALGHRGDVVAVMKARRAERGNGDVAVLDEEDAIPEPSATELQEDLMQLEASYDAWHLALERLWEIEQEGPLSEANFSRKQWLEYQMVQNFQAQEKLRPQLEAAKLREAVYAAQAQHDALVPEVTAQAEAIIETLAELGAAVQTFVATVEAQTAALFPFRDRRGHQQFDLPTGREEAVHLLQRAYPIDYRATDLINMLLDAPLTMGQGLDALEGSPRFQAFSPRAVERYLATLTPEGVRT